ncbi:hypothetical protein [Streptomyces sp. NPDC020681]|uniref:hypothetical protein n=1 Tax=Streptomyces sp. NPDC020681 TaxID=3365083 RepID=UPI00379A2F2C
MTRSFDARHCITVAASILCVAAIVVGTLTLAVQVGVAQHGMPEIDGAFPTAPTPSGTGTSGVCDRIIGPARAHCIPEGPEQPGEAPASGAGSSRAWTVLVPAIALAAMLLVQLHDRLSRRR